VIAAEANFHPDVPTIRFTLPYKDQYIS